MTSLSDRPNIALLVVDVQNDVVANAHGRDEVIANINTLVDRARAEQVPVIWVQHSSEELAEDSDGWQYVSELRTDDFSEYGLPPADKVIAHTNTYWTWQEGRGRTASVVETAAVNFDALLES